MGAAATLEESRHTHSRMQTKHGKQYQENMDRKENGRQQKTLLNLIFCYWNLPVYARARSLSVFIQIGLIWSLLFLSLCCWLTFCLNPIARVNDFVVVSPHLRQRSRVVAFENGI